MSIAGTLEQLRAAAPVVAPSMLLCDFGDLKSEVERLEQAGARVLHLDVMDGQFVPNFTYGLPIVAAFRRLTNLPLDVHLMIDRPERYVGRFVEAGANMVTIHLEATERPAEALAEIRRAGAAAGAAINPKTPVETLIDVLPQCDLALVMSVEAGFGGQKFDPVALKKLRDVRRRGSPELILEVDGGVDGETIGPCAAAGAQVFVVGSAIFRTGDYARSIAELSRAAKAGLS
jgi:ribulose-phosphate 3-epimerase